MKKIITLFLVVVFTGCQGQEKEKQEEENVEKELTQKPKGDWEVTRQYDEHGNLIKYDSVFRYAYPNIKGDSVRVNLDSIMNSFQGYFEQHTPFQWNEGFYYFPKADSLFMNDFFKEDYYMDRWKRQPWDLQDMMRKMDSMRNSFLRKHHPGLLESQKEERQ